MSDPKKETGLAYWAKMMSKHSGYAGEFNYRTPEDKRIVEESTAQEWRLSASEKFGVELGAIESNPHDPPDCFVGFGDRTLSVELVQFIDQQHKDRAAKGENPSGGDLFVDMQWSELRFIEKLRQIVSTKGEKYRQRGRTIDVLVIHTAEPWLTSRQVEEWLDDESIQRHPNIMNVFFVFSYEPGRETRRWPIFCAYGDVFGNSAKKTRF